MGKDVAENPAMTLFTYALSHLASKDKIRFYYALKGRDGKSGVVKQYKIDYLAKSVLLVPGKHEQDVEAFLKYWKCSYKKRKVKLL
jgi:peptide subunit release factor 1 (eRF1)